MRNFMMPGRPISLGEHGMVATSHPQATLAGVEILKNGGNAVDAALAAVAVQCVVEPQMTGIGGDCFVLLGRQGEKPISLNGSGCAPAGINLKWFNETGINRILDNTPHSVTIPGAVDAWCQLSSDYGSKGLEEVFSYAIKAAECGYLITPRVSLDWMLFADRLRKFPHAADAFLLSGRAPKVGELMNNIALGKTLKNIALKGRKAFYEGEVAEEIVSILKDLGGPHSMEDFSTQKSFYDSPISSVYKKYTLYECPPNGQGLAALLMVKMLDRFNLSSTEYSPADQIHIFSEITKSAYRQRDAIVCDPHTFRGDTDEVLSSKYIDSLIDNLNLEATSGPVFNDIPNHRDTVYVSVMDKDGTSVSLINSLFHVFGSGIYAPNAGVMLHNRGSGFNLIEHHPNCIGSRKRPMHTIIPGMLYDGEGPIMPFGVMGGQYQAAGHAHFLNRILDFGDDIQLASDRPRSFCFGESLKLEKTISQKTANALTKRGHKIEWISEPLGGCQAVWLDRKRSIFLGASDHRKDGIALGY